MMTLLLITLPSVPVVSGMMTIDDGDGGVAARGTFQIVYNADASADAAISDAPSADALISDVGFPAGTSGCGRPVTLGPTGFQAQRTIQINGQTRSYFVSLLPGYNMNKPQALVFGWHGSSWLGASFRPSIQVESFAQSQGADAIFVYPDGLGNPTGWSGASDLPFFDALQGQIEAEFCVDTNRLYSYGRSFGGFMTNFLACVRGSRFRASAVLSGWGPATPCQKESVWIWHGTQDPTVGVSQGRASRDTWNMIDQTGPKVPYSPPPYCTRYPGPFDVAYCEDPNGVHWHPDGAETFVWNWFWQHGAGGTASADAGSPADASSPDAPGGPAGGPGLGTNMPGIIYWTGSAMLANALKQSSTWSSNTLAAVAQDADGNVTSLQPGQVATTRMFAQGGAPVGDWTLRWLGDATWAVTGATIISSTLGQMIVRVGASGEVDLNLTRVGTPPPTNVRFLVPGATDTDLFNPTYLTSLREARYSALRFMNWMRASDDTLPGGQQPPVFTWPARAQISNIRWSARTGVPVEVIADAANAFGRDAWINLHHTVDDVYVRNAAQVVCGRLRSDLRIYLAHSNEVWNSIFPQYQYASDRGIAAGLDSDPFMAGQKWHAQRTAQMTTIWRQECGAQRIISVLEAQAVNDWVSNQMLSWAQGRGLNFDVLAIAPYFGGDIRAAEATSIDAVFSLINSRSLSSAITTIRAQRVVASRYGLRLAAYEGGQHLTSFNQLATAETVFRACQTDPRIGVAYDTYRQGWLAEAGSNSLFMHFLDVDGWSAAGGYWGSRQSLAESCAATPKCAALSRWP